MSNKLWKLQVQEHNVKSREWNWFHGVDRLSSVAKQSSLQHCLPHLKSVRQRHVTSSAEMAQRRQRTRITDEDNRLAANRRSLRQRRRLRPICRAAWRQKIDCVLHCAPVLQDSLSLCLSFLLEIVTTVLLSYRNTRLKICRCFSFSLV